MAFTDALYQDVAYALRTLRRNAGFTAVTILTLALGIGANAGIFSVISAVLLRPVPFRDPDRVVLLFERGVLQKNNQPNVVSLANFLDWQKESRSFVGMAAVRQAAFNLGGDGGQFLPERIHGALCSWSLFATLDVAPLIGRPFTPEEDRREASPTAIISYALWQQRFGGDPNVLQRKIRLDSKNYDIVGVMPRDFSYPARQVEIWVPVQQILRNANAVNRANHQLYVVARVRPDVPVARAGAEVDGIMQRIFLEHSGELIGHGAMLIPLADVATRGSRTSLLVLFAAVGCLLLIACVNIANLLLARGSQRRRELSIRMALGAARERLFRQMLTESLLLFALGAAAGLVLASVLTTQLAARAPALLGIDDIDTSGDITLNRWVFLFTAVVAMLAGVATGFVPAWQAARAQVSNALREGGRSLTAGVSQGHFRAALVTAEVALSVMLLVAAGLLIRSFGELRNVSPGFRTDHALTASVALPLARYSKPEQIAVFARQLEERVSAVPGVRSVGLVNCLPAGGYCGDNAFSIEGHPLPPGQFTLGLNRLASPSYFSTAGIPLLRGRIFTAQETRTVVISESMAKRFFAGMDPIGQRIYFSDAADAPRNEIVGIVGDVLIGLDEHPRPTYYLPISTGLSTSFSVMVRTEGEPAALAPAVRREISNLDADLPAFRIRTIEEMLDVSAGQREFTALLLGSFAALALLLAAVGLYGVLSYSVAQRTNEIGIRLALGAAQSQVQRLVLVEGLRPAAIGIGVGLAASFGAAQLLRTLLFGIGPHYWPAYVAVPFVLFAVAGLACAVPAWRATRVDPVVALRND